MQVPSILIVDDDPKIRRLLRNCLEPEGYQVVEAGDRAETLSAVDARSLALVTLDLNLNGEDGFDVARAIRKVSDVPIVMVTARADVFDKVVGLEIGADDYIVKPFHQREVVARVRSVLRRAERGAKPEAPQKPAAPVFRFDGMTADTGRMELTDRSGRPIELTAGDFRMLEVFLAAPRRALSRDWIMDHMYGKDWAPFDRSIDNQVARLRKKIEQDPANPKLIKTVRGIGYRFVADVERV